MKYFTDRNHPEVIELLRQGAVGVLRTDTLYGIVTSVGRAESIARLYEARGREKHKPCIVLIADQADLFDAPPERVTKILNQVWPGKVSVVMAAPSAPAYLPKTEGTLAYRMPKDSQLQQLLRQTGPLLAPSANLAGQPPAQDITKAEAYFGDTIDFYVDSGRVESATPSKIIKVDKDGEIERLR